MALTAADRAALTERYARGPALLKAALKEVPAAAMQWRPAPGKWSAHEVIVHCADSETNANARMRYLLAEEQPVIQAYDQERWAKVLDYHALPVDTALATVEAVRANTVPFRKRMYGRDWHLFGTYRHSG